MFPGLCEVVIHAPYSFTFSLCLFFSCPSPFSLSSRESIPLLYHFQSEKSPRKQYLKLLPVIFIFLLLDILEADRGG
jgi:hypothetical protein